MTATAEKEEIATLLGGRRTLGKFPGTYSEAVERGIPWKALFHLKKALRFTDREFSKTLGMSERTLTRRRGAAGRLDLVASDRLFRLARIAAMAAEVFGNAEEGARWLKEPQFGLGGKIPLDLLRTETGAREVEDLLGRLKYGVLS